MAKVCFRLYQYMMREQNFAKAQRFAETGFTAATACSGSADATGRLEITAEACPESLFCALCAASQACLAVDFRRTHISSHSQNHTF